MARMRTSPGPGGGTVSGRISAVNGAANQRARAPSCFPSETIATVGVFDAAVQDQVHPPADDDGVGQDQGVGQVADAEVADSLDPRAQYLGSDADGEAGH